METLRARASHFIIVSKRMLTRILSARELYCRPYADLDQVFELFISCKAAGDCTALDGCKRTVQ